MKNEQGDVRVVEERCRLINVERLALTWTHALSRLPQPRHVYHPLRGGGSVGLWGNLEDRKMHHQQVRQGSDPFGAGILVPPKTHPGHPMVGWQLTGASTSTVALSSGPANFHRSSPRTSQPTRLFNRNRRLFNSLSLSLIRTGTGSSAAAWGRACIPRPRQTPSPILTSWDQSLERTSITSTFVALSRGPIPRTSNA